MVLRGVTRPGVLVEENELASAYQPVDAFCLRWDTPQSHQPKTRRPYLLVRL
jgi:hypothetical protein